MTENYLCPLMSLHSNSCDENRFKTPHVMLANDTRGIRQRHTCGVFRRSLYSLFSKKVTKKRLSSKKNEENVWQKEINA